MKPCGDPAGLFLWRPKKGERRAIEGKPSNRAQPISGTPGSGEAHSRNRPTRLPAQTNNGAAPGAGAASLHPPHRRDPDHNSRLQGQDDSNKERRLLQPAPQGRYHPRLQLRRPQRLAPCGDTERTPPWAKASGAGPQGSRPPRRTAKTWSTVDVTWFILPLVTAVDGSALLKPP